LSYFTDLPDCETEEELRRAIQLQEFMMDCVDDDVEVLNRYTQWLRTHMQNGELVPRTLEEFWDMTEELFE
jgi:uncharacterized protein YrzB (UPF0473 family)